MPKMINDGWVKIHRKLLEWEWWDDDATLRLWIFILLKANHQDHKWRGIVIKKGEFVTSYATINRQTKLSLRTIRTVFSRLKSTNQITIKTTNKYSIIQVQNWEDHQINDKQIDKPNNNRATNNRQTTDNKQERLKNDKNDNIPDQNNRVQEKEIKIAERLPLNKQLRIHRVVYHLEDATGTKIVNWGKQGEALMKMLRAGYTEQEIVKCISHMATRDEFFSEKGFDLMTVANQIARYKAQTSTALKMRKGVNTNGE